MNDIHFNMNFQISRFYQQKICLYHITKKQNTIFIEKKNQVDLPEIKGNHRKFRTLVTSYIGKRILTPTQF